MRWKILALVAGFLIILAIISQALVKYELVNVSFKIVPSNSVYINKVYYNARYAVFIYNQSKLNIDVTQNYLNFLSKLPAPASYYINITVLITPLNVTLSNLTWIAIYKLDFKTYGTNGTLTLHVIDGNLQMEKTVTLHYNGSWLNSSLAIFNVTLNVTETEYKVWIVWASNTPLNISSTFPAIRINNIVGYLVS